MIRIKILATLLVSSSTLCFGQDLPKERSNSHVQIQGTNIFMIPPKSFQHSGNFKGFQNPGDPASMIMTLEIPGPYSEVKKGFNADMLKTKGMILKSRKDIKVASFDALLIEVNQSANNRIFAKHILIYGNEKSTTLINGIYLSDSLKIGQDIKQSILSTFVDSQWTGNPREALGYSLNESAGSLKFKAVVENGMIFNRDLKTPTESIDKATLITDKSFAKTDIENKKLFCVSRLKKYPDSYSLITDKGINEIELDSLKGYELFAKNSNHLEEEMYQVIVFADDGGYYLFVGTYMSDSEQAKTDIKNIIRTFKRTK
ncbi:hypothetical protein [Pedobacter faecalis]|uniref:hypothetical protein n=1 Tax=Pedobacter faecalis TaxID=3041495 RepID=UPI00254C788F|nr:hypothetical protein [Pedobacter sp. ELA7]